MAREGNATRLRDVRARLAMTQRELAAELSVSAGAVNLWENGERAIPGPVVRLIELYESELAVTPSASPMRDPEPRALPRALRTAGALLAWQVLHNASRLPFDGPMAARVRRALARRIVRELGSLKGLSMKMGQLVGFLDFVLPEVERDEISRIHESATPMSPAAATAVFLEELGRLPREVFAEWTTTPLACGSVGQVHSAALANGDAVAVKIQYPGMKVLIQRDLDGAGRLDRLYRTLLRVESNDDFFGELSRRFLAECDYHEEAANLERAADTFAGHRGILVPRVFRPYSSRRVLSMSLERGRTLAEFAATATQKQRDLAGAHIWEFYWRSALQDGCYNTDPQPGNLLFRDDGSVVFLDFGRVKTFSPNFLREWRGILRALLERDQARVHDQLIAWGTIVRIDRVDLAYGRKILHFLYQPILLAEPFAFTGEQVRAAWRVWGPENPNNLSIRYSGDMVFMDQLIFGVNAVLSRLGARVRCRDIVLPLLYDNPAQASSRPTPYTREELKRAME